MPPRKRMLQALRDFERKIDGVCPCPCGCNCLAHAMEVYAGWKRSRREAYHEAYPTLRIDRCGHCQNGDCGQEDIEART
jgi:hypothetical protein